MLQINERIKQIDNKPFFYREKCSGRAEAEATSLGIKWTKWMFSVRKCAAAARTMPFCVRACAMRKERSTQCLMMMKRGISLEVVVFYVIYWSNSYNLINLELNVLRANGAN